VSDSAAVRFQVDYRAVFADETYSQVRCPADPGKTEPGICGCGVACADLGIVVGVSNPYPDPGEAVSFTASVTNYGDDVVTEPFVHCNVSWVTCPSTPGGTNIELYLPSLAPGQTLSLGAVWTGTVGGSGYCGVGRMDATVYRLPWEPSDPNLGNNMSEAQFLFLYGPP